MVNAKAGFIMDQNKEKTMTIKITDYGKTPEQIKQTTKETMTTEEMQQKYTVKLILEV